MLAWYWNIAVVFLIKTPKGRSYLISNPRIIKITKTKSILTSLNPLSEWILLRHQPGKLFKTDDSIAVLINFSYQFLHYDYCTYIISWEVLKNGTHKFWNLRKGLCYEYYNKWYFYFTDNSSSLGFHPNVLITFTKHWIENKTVHRIFWH